MAFIHFKIIQHWRNQWELFGATSWLCISTEFCFDNRDRIKHTAIQLFRAHNRFLHTILHFVFGAWTFDVFCSASWTALRFDFNASLPDFKNHIFLGCFLTTCENIIRYASSTIRRNLNGIYNVCIRILRLVCQTVTRFFEFLQQNMHIYTSNAFNKSLLHQVILVQR